MTRRRRGFTLFEMTIVLMVLAIVTGLSVPAMVRFGARDAGTGSDRLIELLTNARRLAIQRAVQVDLVIDPETGHYRVDSTGVGGMGLVAEDTLDLAITDALETDLPRLRYRFRVTGAAFGDTVVIRGADSTRVLQVDRWSGVAHAIAR